jgi:hypothetical protein
MTEHRRELPKVAPRRRGGREVPVQMFASQDALEDRDRHRAVSTDRAMDDQLARRRARQIHRLNCANVKQSSEALAAAIIDYILANADITVTVRTTDAGLQRTPNPNNPNTATQGPAADVEITGVLT